MITFADTFSKNSRSVTVENLRICCKHFPTFIPVKPGLYFMLNIKQKNEEKKSKHMNDARLTIVLLF